MFTNEQSISMKCKIALIVGLLREFNIELDIVKEQVRDEYTFLNIVHLWCREYTLENAGLKK